jgi:hypothetical protein
MIKIERSTAVKPTILRNGARQPVTLNMTVTAEELASLTAESGTIIYSVDELEVKVLDFQPVQQPTTGPVIDATPVAPTLSAAKVAKPIVQPARKTASATQA